MYVQYVFVYIYILCIYVCFFFVFFLTKYTTSQRFGNTLETQNVGTQPPRGLGIGGHV